MSRSTYKLEVGTFKDGTKRFEIRHANDLKLAHPKSLTAPVSRPTLGRPSASSSEEQLTAPEPSFLQKPSNQFGESEPAFVSMDNAASTESKQTNFVGTSCEPTHATSIQQRPAPASTANEEFEGAITGPPPAPAFSRPARSTRNPNPYYVDGLSFASLY